ncbi:type IV pilus secretin PilQ [Cupriavidus sp. UME77]|uniref:secretin N-terminal domain-containing protein n=1 Tax=Cupriavidus sp. UME77 TaxID=1862321 RepID=UPI001603AA5C
MKSRCRSDAACRVERCDASLRSIAASGCTAPRACYASYHARRFSAALIAMVLGGCAVEPGALRNASVRHPTDAEMQLNYMHERNGQMNAMLDEVDRLRASYQFHEAALKLDEASRIDPTSERGRKLGAALQIDLRDLVILAEVQRMLERGSYDSAAERVRDVLAENPTNVQAQQMMRLIEDKRRQLRAAREEKSAAASIMRTPVTLQFRDANVRMVFEALSRTSGLNVIFDRDVRTDLKTTIFVTNAAIEDAVNLILLQNQLDKKVLNANTLFIYPATPNKQLEYQELKVRTFQLSNIDAKQVQALLKSLLKIKEIVIDEHANTLSIRGTPDTIRLAEQLIAAQDLPEPEVMLEVQVLEVSHERLTDLGIAWPNSFTMATPSTASTWGALHTLPINQLVVSGLSATANFKLTDTDANLLASPRIRTRNKEKAKILIGDKVPVISSSSTPSTSGPSYAQNIQYLDVGIKLEVEPQVYRDDDVGIKISLEVSNITKTISSSNAQTGLSSLAYQIGTRSASTSLRLRDGETQVLGGLISDADRTTADKVPGLGQLPVLGRLFSDHNGDHVKTEIVLQITPHIIRPQRIADADTREIWSGTDTNVRTEQLRLDATSAEAPVAAPGTPFKPGRVGGGTVAPVVPVAPVAPASVDGAAVGGNAKAAAAGSAVPPAPLAVPPRGSLGQPPAAPRTTPPPDPFAARFPAIQSAPPAPAASAAPDTGAAAPDATAAAVVTPVPAPSVAPAQPPTPMVTMPSNGMATENPLYPIPGAR